VQHEYDMRAKSPTKSTKLGLMLIGWSTAVIIEILRRGGQTAPSID
jgi:hypothetical protein